jgi:hypothetical protein
MNQDYSNKYQKYKLKYLEKKNKTINMIGGGNENIDALLKMMTEHKILIKMLHFQTKSYGYHKTLDSYLCIFLSKFDKLFEVIQGCFNQQLDTSNINIECSMLNDNNITSYLQNFKKMFIEITNNLINTNPNTTMGITNIRDDILSEIDNLIYLLMFK